MKKTTRLILLLGILSTLLCVSALAADVPTDAGIYDINPALGVTIEAKTASDGSITPATVGSYADFYAGAEKLTVRYSAATKDKFYLLIVTNKDLGQDAPTASNIVYIDQVTAASNTVSFNVYPSALSAGTYHIYLSSNAGTGYGKSGLEEIGSFESYVYVAQKLSFKVGEDGVANGNAFAVKDGSPTYGKKWSEIIDKASGLKAVLGDDSDENQSNFKLYVGDKVMTADAIPDVGTYTVTLKYSGTLGGNPYSDVEVDKKENVQIGKATPTGKPTYTAITTSGKTLADAALTVGTIKPTGGTIKWNLGGTQTVTANTPYDWTYTPADTTNYNNLTGSITPYVMSGDDAGDDAGGGAGGGGGGAGGGGGGGIGGGAGGGGGGGVAMVTGKSITIDKTVNGTVSSDVETAMEDDTVTLTVAPDKGFTLKTLTVTDKTGKEISVKNLGNNKFSFTMPGSNVTVNATFVKDNTVRVSFADVKATDYYHDAVLWAVENEITSGTDAVHFSPLANCTRGQTVTFLWRAAGCPEPVSTINLFADVDADAYYYKAVLWAVEQGITNGTGDAAFDPDATVNRGQVVTFLFRTAKAAAVETASPFGDVAQTDYYSDAVAWAVANDITNGTSDTTFSPSNECTRGQIVTFLYRHFAK